MTEKQYVTFIIYTKHTAGYVSIPKLAQASDLSEKRVKGLVQRKVTYTLHHQARKVYPTFHSVVHDIDEQWKADLADVYLLTRQNRGYWYILTVIDIFRVMRRLVQ